MHYCKSDQALTYFKGAVSCENPSDKIYQFDGVMHIGDNQISLNYENFVLRGASLKNTDWIYGLVTYPGHDTRIMRNSCGAQVKFSKIEK